MSRHTPLRVAFRRPWPGTRRGLKLWLFAVIIGLKGLGYATGGSASTTDSALRVVTRIAPLELWGLVIVGVCVFSAFCAYCHHGRDRYGYMALVGFSLAWAAAYATGPLFLHGPAYAYQGALSWLTIGGLLLFCADDPDPIP